MLMFEIGCFSVEAAVQESSYFTCFDLIEVAMELLSWSW